MIITIEMLNSSKVTGLKIQSKLVF